MVKTMTAAARRKEKRSSEDGDGSELDMAIRGVRALLGREERGRVSRRHKGGRGVSE
jgi:hypothetical protein